MRVFLLVGFLCLTGVSWAQEENTRVNRKAKIKARAEQKKRKLDSLSNRLQQIDLTAPVDSLGGLIPADTLPNVSPVDSLHRINRYLTERVDSLSLQSHTDSLSNRIRQLGDNLEKRADSIGSKVTDKLDDLQQNVSDKIQRTINGKTGEQVEMPELNKSGLSNTGELIPALDLKLPDTKFPDFNEGTSLPNIPSIADPSIPDLSISELKLPSTDATLDLRNLPSATDSLPLKDLSGLPSRLGMDTAKIRESLGVDSRMAPYIDRADSLSMESLQNMGMEEIEAYAENSKPVQELSEELKRANAIKAEQEAMLQRYQDKKFLMEDIKRKSANVANDVINPLSEEFKQAQQATAKARRLNPAVQSFKEIVRKRPNEMKNKPFYERLVPGIGLQPFNGADFEIDVAPFLSYRITGRWSAGLGGVYRVAFNSDNRYYAGQGGVYGFRGFADFNVLKGFFAHAEMERLHLDYAIKPPAETEFQQRTWNGYVGIGKQVPLTRKINTTVTALYRIEIKGYLPGTSHFGIRMAFIYVTKKVRKPTALE